LESFLREARATSRSADTKIAEVAVYLVGFSERFEHLRGGSTPLVPNEALDELTAARLAMVALQEEHRVCHASLERARLLLEQERAKYLHLLESTRDASILTNIRAVVREANSATGALLNMPARFMVGKPLLHFVARQDTREFRARLLELEAHPGNDNFDLHLRPRHGRVVRAEVAASPVRARDGGVMGLRWVLRVSGRPSSHDDAEAAPEGDLSVDAMATTDTT
jgi:PAS domain S-box-containing protein